MGLEFKALLGKTLKRVKINDDRDEIIFTTIEGEIFIMNHSQDCCETVVIEDINGDLNDLVGCPILIAEENTSDENPIGYNPEYQESFTWTFYKLATRKGYVDIRWYGESNGYYSESVSFYQLQ